MAPTKKIYGSDDRLLCAVCSVNTAVHEDMPYCTLCGSQSEGLLSAHNKIGDIQRGVADLAMGFSQRAMTEISIDMQRAMESLDQAKKKLESHRLLNLEKFKRGLTSEL